MVKFCQDCHYGLLSFVDAEPDYNSNGTGIQTARIIFRQSKNKILEKERFDAFWEILKTFGELHFPFLLLANYLKKKREECDNGINGGYDTLSCKIEEDYYNYDSNSNSKTTLTVIAKLSPSRAQLEQERKKVDRSKENKRRKEGKIEKSINNKNVNKRIGIIKDMEIMTEDETDSCVQLNRKAVSFKPPWIVPINNINNCLKKISDGKEKNVSIVEFVTPVVEELGQFYSRPHYGVLSWSDSDYKKVEFTPSKEIIETEKGVNAFWEGLQVFGREYFPFLTEKYLEKIREQYNNSNKFNDLGRKIGEDYRVAARKAAKAAKEAKEAKEAQAKVEAVGKVNKETDDDHDDQIGQHKLLMG